MACFLSERGLRAIVQINTVCVLGLHTFKSTDWFRAFQAAALEGSREVSFRTGAELAAILDGLDDQASEGGA